VNVQSVVKQIVGCYQPITNGYICVQNVDVDLIKKVKREMRKGAKMTYEIRIRKVRNGFILTNEEDQEEGKLVLEHVVPFAEHGDEEDNEREALTHVLEMIVDYFDLPYKKHHKPHNKFIKIKMVLGDHYWDDDKSLEF
jgi:hypothetical protein